MTMTEEQGKTTNVVYDLQGTLLEACSCGILCPCWVGEDPDGGSCDAFNAYHFDAGTIRGVDVSGLSLVKVVRIPGNVLAPNSWRQVIFVDDRASKEQAEALDRGLPRRSRRPARRSGGTGGGDARDRARHDRPRGQRR